jgi:hypothetical protein
MGPTPRAGGFEEPSAPALWVAHSRDLFAAGMEGAREAISRFASLGSHPAVPTRHELVPALPRALAELGSVDRK